MSFNQMQIYNLVRNKQTRPLWVAAPAAILPLRGHQLGD